MAVLLDIATKLFPFGKSLSHSKSVRQYFGHGIFLQFLGNIVYCVNISRFDDAYIVVGHVWTAKKDPKIHSISLRGHPMRSGGYPLTT